MNRETFLNELMAGLTQLGPVEQRQVADYYNELIFDGVENGKPEEEIIAGFGRAGGDRGADSCRIQEPAGC